MGGAAVVGVCGSGVQHRWMRMQPRSKGAPDVQLDPIRPLRTRPSAPRPRASLALALAILVPAAASQARRRSAPSSSPRSRRTPKGVEEGGLFATKDGHYNQLTEDPADVEPAFSPDGRTIAFAREGHIYSVRPDGSGQRRLTSGPAIDSAPRISPNGKFVVFERREVEGGPADLFTVGASGGGLHRLTSGTEDDTEATFSPEGTAIVFVRGTQSGGRVKDDLYSVRPNGSGLARLTTTANVDEFAPHYFAGGIVFSRGDDSETAAAFADIYTMRRNGTRIEAAGPRRRLGLRRRRLAAGPHGDLPPRPGSLGEADRPAQGGQADRAARRLEDQLGLLLRRPPRRRLHRKRRSRPADVDRRHQRSQDRAGRQLTKAKRGRNSAR